MPSGEDPGVQELRQQVSRAAIAGLTAIESDRLVSTPACSSRSRQEQPDAEVQAEDGCSETVSEEDVSGESVWSSSGYHSQHVRGASALGAASATDDEDSDWGKQGKLVFCFSSFLHGSTKA